MYKKVIDLLEQAKCPVLIVGNGARDAIRDINILMRELHIPTLTSMLGADLIPTDHYLFCGHPGTIGNNYANWLLQQADVVLCIGTRNNLRQIGFNHQAKAKYIVVDIDKSELKKPTLKPYLAIHQDAGVFTNGLLKNLRGINPYCCARKITECLSEDGVVVASNGMACISLLHAGVVKSHTKFIMNSGCASMGYGLPAAVGAYYGTGKPVVCIEGDGSLQMNIQELATIAHHKLPITIYVYDNGGYASIRQTQNAYFSGRHIGSTPKDFTLPNIEKLAEVYGVNMHRVNLSGQCIRKGIV